MDTVARQRDSRPHVDALREIGWAIPATPSAVDFCQNCGLGTYVASSRRSGRSCGFCGAPEPPVLEVAGTTPEGMPVWLRVDEVLDILRPTIVSLVHDLLIGDHGAG